MSISNLGSNIEITDPQVRDVAQHVLDTMKLGIQKGIAHMIDPRAYPIPSNANTIEKRTITFLQQSPQSYQEAAKRNVQTFLEQPASVMENLYGHLSKIDLHSEISVKKQVHDQNLATHVKLKREHLYALEFVGNTVRRREELSRRLVYPQPGHSDLDLGNRPPLIVVPVIGTVVVEPIDQKYFELGGKEGFLGNPIGGRGRCPDGKGKFHHYQGGSIYWSPESGAHEVHGAIREKWKSLGWETSFLGYPKTDELTTPDNIGRYNHFQGGSIYWTPETGAHEVHGHIRGKWKSLDWEKGYLGYPTTDETKTPDRVGRFNHFQGGSIYWTPQLGAHAVHKTIKDEWENQGWELGFLGYPISDTLIGHEQMISHFQGGGITWDKATGTRITTPITKLRFRIHRVKCIDETGWSEWGGDVIDLGGVVTSINNGVVSKVSPFRVHSDFDDNDQIIYDPPKNFFTFDLKEILGWSKNFVVTMAMVERGHNDTFSEFLSDLLKEIRDEVVSLISEEAHGLVGAALGSFLGSFAGLEGVIIGAVVGWTAGKVVEWISGYLDDQYFPLMSASLVLPSAFYRWDGYKDSPEDTSSTSAHGGKYQVWYDWELLP